MESVECKIIEGNSFEWVHNNKSLKFDLTFFDPPFNRKKYYRIINDNIRPDIYWASIEEMLDLIYERTSYGGSMYFLHREKEIDYLLSSLKDTKWNIKNLIIWKKKSAPPPIKNHYNKQYQIITYAIKGKRPKIFNKIRIDKQIPSNYKLPKNNGYQLTDVWDDIRELTSGFFAGNEVLRDIDGNRDHLQQTPVGILLRILLCSTTPGDFVFDPMAGIGTTAIVAKQLKRNSINIEIDPLNVRTIERRVEQIREADCIERYYNYYRHTPNLSDIWGKSNHSKIL
jgi:site-specific DNA-methyltransferase (adenine-specific)